MDIDLDIEREELEKLLDDNANACYRFLMDEGITPLIESREDPTMTLDNLIYYFESKEEYIKCSNILKIKEQYEAESR